MPTLLSPDHLANTTPYKVLAWVGLALVVVKIGWTSMATKFMLWSSAPQPGDQAAG